MENKKDMENRMNYIIPEGTETLDDEAFANHPELQNITLPSTLRKIGDLAFDNCISLKAIAFPEGLEEIGVQCFWGCSSLASVELPSTIKKIKENVFYGCDNLRSLTVKTPQVFRCKSFEYKTDIPEECTIYVPQHLVAAYKEDDFWGRYTIETLKP